MPLLRSKFLVIISLISSSVVSESLLFLTSISVMFGAPTSESFKVAAFESSMKLHEMSRLFMDWLIFRNSARDSQNMWLSEFDDSERLSRFELLFRRSMHSFEPALSSSRFSFSDKCFSTLFTFRAWARYLEPS